MIKSKTGGDGRKESSARSKGEMRQRFGGPVVPPWPRMVAGVHSLGRM